ncbi:MAG: hypothetical protein Q8O90_12425, partial [Elusimicrobiota bacterium]|nr:hypothetical protein [Elusimicrobiota bacterium]
PLRPGEHIAWSSTRCRVESCSLRLNEGLDIPDVNTVLFLRPTDSLTVFLQQLGRGLRHSSGKDYLQVLDFVAQMHRRYRVDRKFAALLPGTRYNIEREIEHGFPHVPPGCGWGRVRY